MFSKTLLQSIPYAQQLESKRIHLSIPAQSPLGALMSYSSADNPEAFEATEDFLTKVDNVTIMEGGLSEHDHFTATLVDELVPLVQSHIRVSREIGQMASELVNQVTGYVNSVPAKDASGEFNVVKDEVPSIFEEAAVLALIERASTAPVNQLYSNLCSGPRAFDDLLDYLVSGNSKLDDKVKEMVAGYPSAWLENIWYGLFAASVGLSSSINLTTFQTLPTGERLAAAYASYLIATKLLSDTPKDAMGSLGQFEAGVADLRDYMLIALKGALGEQEHQQANKVLAISYRKYDRSVIVNASVYREWLEAGGSPELLLGSLLSNNPAYTVDEFNQRGSEFQRQWGGFCAIHNAEADVRRSNFLRGIYLTCFSESLGKVAGFEEDFRKANPQFAEKAISKAETLLSNTGIQALGNVEAMALELVAGIRFDYTPAKMILTDIDQTLKSSPDVDVREAALVAAANYLALYLAGQISIATA